MWPIEKKEVNRKKTPKNAHLLDSLDKNFNYCMVKELKENMFKE